MTLRQVAVGLGVVTGLGAAHSLAAQAADPLPPAGTRVRVILESPLDAYKGGAEPSPKSLVATFVDADSGRLVVRQSGGAELQLPTSNVRRLEVSGSGRCRGVARRMRCAALGTISGAAFGLTLATVFGPSYVDREVCSGIACDPRPYRHARRVVIISGAAFGLGIGLIVGRERWTRVTGWPPSH
jgi:hypothetical protein